MRNRDTNHTTKELTTMNGNDCCNEKAQTFMSKPTAALSSGERPEQSRLASLIEFSEGNAEYVSMLARRLESIVERLAHEPSIEGQEVAPSSPSLIGLDSMQRANFNIRDRLNNIDELVDRLNGLVGL